MLELGGAGFWQGRGWAVRAGQQDEWTSGEQCLEACVSVRILISSLEGRQRLSCSSPPISARRAGNRASSLARRPGKSRIYLNPISQGLILL
jgi:hypothetical protein